MKMETSLVAPFRGRVRQRAGRLERSRGRARPAASARADRGHDAGRRRRPSGSRSARWPRTRRRAAALPGEPPPARMGGARLRRRCRRGRADRRRPARRLRGPAGLRPGARPRGAPPAHAVRRPAGAHPAAPGRRGVRGRARAAVRRSTCMPSCARSTREPRDFRTATPTQLRRALRHYGVESLDRTPALEQACYRLFLAQQRAATAQGAVLAILDRRLEQAETLAGAATPDFRAALDGLAAATDGRDPVVADLALQVRFALLRRPRDRGRPRRGLRTQPTPTWPRSRTTPRAPTATRGIAALVACPQPLAPTFARRMADAPSPPATRAAGGDRAPLLPRTHARGVRRDDRRRPPVRHLALPARRTAPPASRPRSWTWPSCRTRHGRSRRGPAGCPPASRLSRTSTPRTPSRPGRPSSQTGSTHCWTASPCPPPCTASSSAQRHRGPAASCRSMTSITLRPSGDGLVEDEPLRGLHPMMSAPPAPGPPVGVRARATARRRGRLRVPRRRAREREGRAAVRAGRGS